MKPLIAITIGVVSSFISSFLFLLVLLGLKPRIEISPKISKYVDTKNREVYVMKIINKGKRDAIDVTIVFHLVRETAVSGGLVRHSKRLMLQTKNILNIPKFRRSDKEADYAFRIKSLEKLEMLLNEAENAYLRLRLTAKDAISGATIVVEQRYYTLDSIREGQFMWGNSFEIISIPNKNIKVLQIHGDEEA